MSDVSNRIVQVALTAVRDRGLSVSDWLEGSGLSEREIANSRDRIDWEQFCVLMHRLEHFVGGPAGLRRLGRTPASEGPFQLIFTIIGSLSSARDIYLYGGWFGGSLFGITEDVIRREADGTVYERITIPEPYPSCEPLFHVLHGVLEIAPTIFGFDESEVEAKITPRSVEYRIQPPPGRGTVARRFWRIARFPKALKDALNELNVHKANLVRKNRALRLASERAEEQAERLAKINGISAELSRHIELDALAETLADVIDREVQPSGIEIWLFDLAGRDRRLGQRGHCGGQPRERHALSIASRGVGRIDIWGPTNADPMLWADMLPWIAIALDNARSHAAVRDHNLRLESRVAERTAELVKTNAELHDQVAERRRAHEALAESTAQLRSAERLASVGTFASGIAHEINNPVASILAASEFALECREDGDAAEVAHQALEDVVEHAMRCAAIVRGVLQFARDEASEKQHCDLRQLLERAIGATATHARRNRIQLVAPEAGPSVPVHAQSFALEQALLNIVRNAVDASQPEDEVLCSISGSDEFQCVEVRDAGCGIEPAHLDRIFDPFFTTRRQRGGYGLGLSIAHGIVAEHLGRIEVESEPGKGTRMRILLPPAHAWRDDGEAP